jgi:hypothetical protein
VRGDGKKKGRGAGGEGRGGGGGRYIIENILKPTVIYYLLFSLNIINKIFIEKKK